MDLEELEQRIKDFQAKELPRILSRKAYSIGNHPGILQPAPKADPDNRKPVPFLKKAIQQIKGYMAKPGAIKYSGEYMEIAQPILDLNNEALLTAMLLEDGATYGKSFELHYTNAAGDYRMTIVKPEESIPIYNDAIEQELEGFIRWWRRGDVEYATHYDSIYRTEYKKDGKAWEISEAQKAHGFDNIVPVNEYVVARDRRNLIDHVLPLIDLYDKLISEDVANELSRYANALLVMAERLDTLTTDENGLKIVDKLKELKLLDGLGDGDVRSKVAYITKDAQAEFISFASETVERLIYEQLQIINPSTLNTNDVSGPAMAYKLLPMEYLCASIEGYFSIGLQRRFQIMAKNSLVKAGDPDTVSIETSRNLPKNIPEIAQTLNVLAQAAATLAGRFSKKTIMKMFIFPGSPFENLDIDQELIDLEAEMPEVVFPTGTEDNGATE